MGHVQPYDVLQLDFHKFNCIRGVCDVLRNPMNNINDDEVIMDNDILDPCNKCRDRMT